MARINKLKRQRIRSNRMDLTDMRELMEDGRIWFSLAIVIVPEGESSHFELTSGPPDVLVDVETVPDQLDLTCRLASFGGGANIGIWAIPPVGSEVLVAIPDGIINFQPSIIATLSSGDLPDGVAPNVTVIANGEVLIHDGNGGTDQLVKKTAYAAHVHPTGVGPSGVADNAAVAASFTSILKAK